MVQQNSSKPIGVLPLLLLGLYCTFLFSSTAKSWLPAYVPFVVTSLLIAVVGFRFRERLRPVQFKIPECYALLILVFGLIIFLHGIAGDQAFDGSVYFVKFVAIAFLFLLCFKVGFHPTLVFQLAFFVFVANVLVLGLGVILELVWRSGIFIQRSGDGRLLTLLSSPGTLWKSSFMVLPGLTYLFLRSGQMRWLIFFLLGTVVVSIDGSRTGFMLFCLFLVVFLPFYARATGWSRMALMRSILLIFLGTSSLFSARAAIDNLLHSSFFVESTQPLSTDALVDRFAGLREVLQSKTEGVESTKGELALRSEQSAELVQENDHWRLRMLELGFERALDFPLVGDGTLSTAILTVHGPMVVHMSYLQVFGDYGLFGFLVFVLLMVLPMVVAVRRVSDIFAPGLSEVGKAGLLCSFVLLFAYPLYGLLHPLSNEFSEWAPYLVAFSVVLTIRPATVKKSPNDETGLANRAQ